MDNEELKIVVEANQNVNKLLLNLITKHVQKAFKVHDILKDNQYKVVSQIVLDYLVTDHDNNNGDYEYVRDLHFENVSTNTNKFCLFVFVCLFVYVLKRLINKTKRHFFLLFFFYI